MSSLTTTDRLKDLLPQLFNEQRQEGNYYLRFQLTNDISALLDLSYVQESVTVDSSQITAVPNLPEYVVGMISSRNQVFLAVDLAHLVGFAPETINQRQYQTVVVQINSGKNNIQSHEVNLYGLTVKAIQGISRILPEQFNSVTTSVPDTLRPFVQGFVQDSVDECSFLIDLNRLMKTQLKS